MHRLSTSFLVASDDSRRCRLLEAALAVFARYGFKKSSMDEIARAADLSRQGLYGHFSTKEELFRAAVKHALATALAAATERLRDPDAAIAAQLIGGFDEWTGRYVGLMQGADVAELVELKETLVRDLVTEAEHMFLEAVTRAIRASGLVAAYKSAGLTARQLAETLNATARGLKHSSTSRPQFVDAITIAVRAMCVPL